MQIATPSDSLDVLLSQHPFGNSDYLHKQLHICYKRRLGKIAVHLPAAGRLLEAISHADAYHQYRVLGDTVVRCAVQHALRQLETGAPYGLPLTQCDAVFRAAIAHLAAGTDGPLGSGLENCLKLASCDSWIWIEERPNDVIARSFRQIVVDNYSEPLCTPGAHELAMLGRGAQLLAELLPLSSRSALRHVQFVAVFPAEGKWARTASSSQFRLSGTVFLNRARLTNPWWVAEHLLHEALHQQLYDFRHGHSLLGPSFGQAGAPKACSPWNLPDSKKSNYWDTFRVLAAFHVYVYLALLAMLAEQRAPELANSYGPLDGPLTMTGSRNALARAHYLAEQLRQVCWSDLGLAGQSFVDWFASVLEALDPSPPPQGSYVHLFLDRYRREASEIGHLLKQEGRPSNLPCQLAKLADEEASRVRHVLASVDSVGLDRFDAALTAFSGEAIGAEFVAVRNLIAKTLLGASPDGYGWVAENHAPDEMVRQMVESSSESLMSLLAR